jgi:general secretion pathway protein G
MEARFRAEGNKTMKKQDEGFTLIELLIVIVILGILATVVVFSVRGITDDGQKNACETDERTMEVAVEAYFAKYGGTAVSEQDLVDSGLIRDLSDNADVTGTGGVTATAGGDCDGVF